MLQLLKDGEPVTDAPLIRQNSGFFYALGGIGASEPYSGWVLDDGQHVWSLISLPEPEPAPEPELTPEQRRAEMPPLSPPQFRKMLRRQGITVEQVEDVIESIPDPLARGDALDDWEYATYFERSNALLEMVGLGLGLTSEQIDDIWMNTLAGI